MRLDESRRSKDPKANTPFAPAGGAVGNESSLALAVSKVHSYSGYLRYQHINATELSRRRTLEQQLISGDEGFALPGFCYSCRAPQEFLVDFNGAYEVDGALTPNWRERLVCTCGLNNRLRASVHLFDLYCRPNSEASIYLTEQTTPLFRWYSERFRNVTGSEYLGNRVPFGDHDSDAVRNENLTRLSFPAEHFDHILSFDVLEHIPDYRQALRECCRVLKPGGSLLLSAPFAPGREETLVRARMAEDGSVEHLMPPEYHGDPLSSAGCLCFYHFGWDLVGALRAAGFASATALVYWSRDYGYLGGDQIMFLARKSKRVFDLRWRQWFQGLSRRIVTRAFRGMPGA